MLCIRINLEKELQPHKLSPDWKGAERVAGGEVPEPVEGPNLRQWSGQGPTEPWKAGKNCVLAIFTRKFSYKNLPHLYCKETTRRPWRCLFAVQGKNCKMRFAVLTAGFNCNMLQKMIQKAITATL